MAGHCWPVKHPFYRPFQEVLANPSEDLQKYFYATDHHWKATGALKAAPDIVRQIEAVLNLPQQDLKRS
ncbi:MAG: hypothetical protein IJV69_07080 [Kiritimatiellae bacterium]|nr:hypothetical protein [Kiritimatiellia bacterium]